MKKIILVLICLTGILNLKSQTTITIGSGTLSSGTQESSPINIWYRSHHCQIIYTAAELNAAGWSGQGLITQLGFNIISPPIYGLPNFTVKVKNTLVSDVSMDDAAGLTTVYNSALYNPTSGGFELLNLSNTHTWDGTSNLLIDVCFDQVPNYDGSGAVNTFTYTSGLSEYSYVRNDASSQCAVPTSTNNILANPSAKPQLQLTMFSLAPCNGTPNAGNAITSNSLVCANTSFNLSLSNLSFGSGTTFQWQNSPDGSSWSNLGSSQPSWNYQINSISNTTYYRCITTCSNSALSNTSTPVVVNLNPLINCYCLPSYSWNCFDGDKIIDFTFSNLTNQTNTCDIGGFSDWTGTPAAEINLNAGNTYTFNTSTSTSGLHGDATVGFYIDFNQNAIFEASEFTYLGHGAGLTYSNSVTVPITVSSGSVRMRIILDVTGNTTTDACNNINFTTYGQILDYKVNLTAAPLCSGTPGAGVAISSATSVCENTPFTLDLSGNSVSSGITYQWQYSLNGTTWVNLGSAQSTIPYSINTQSITTYYRCITTCTNSGLTNNSASITVNQNLPTACFCVPQSISCANSSITNVLLESINNNPICDINGYTDNTISVGSATLTANQTYTISTNLNVLSGNGYVGCWIDFNQNGIFEVNEYTNIGTAVNGPVTGTISVPYTAIGGNTRLRIKLESTWADGLILDPCYQSNYDGQILDYSIYVIASPACSGTPNAGDAIASKTLVCSSDKINLDLTNNSIVSNATYLWQLSSDNINWTDLGPSQSTVPYYISSQLQTTYYRCIVECSNSSLSDTSSIVTINQNTLLNCYCIPPPTSCANNDVITNVLFATLSNTSTCGTDGYEDFTGSVASATVTAGQTYTLTATVGNDFSQEITSWIDYNQNGNFESNEYTYIGYSPGTGIYNITSTLTIPMGATPGLTRLRVRNISSGFFLGAADACFTPTYMPKSSSNSSMPFLTNGETEDYLVTILPPDCSIINLPPTINVSGSTNICLGQTTTLDFSSSIPSATGLSYQWKSSTGGAYTNIGPNATTFSTTPTINTSYYCEITCNGTAIKNTDTVFVNVTSISTAPVSTNTLCNGACNGTITLNATSSSSLIYNWQPSGTSTTDIATGLCAGSYTATITDGQGNCAITNTFVINQTGVFSASISSSNSVICEQLEDTLKSTVVGGLAPLQYNWVQLPSSNISSSVDYTYTTSVGSFSYGLTVTDANNCSATSNTISITVNPSSNISGTVTTNTVTPVAGRVILYKYKPFFTQFDSVAVQNIGAAGDYNFTAFTAGNYIVKAVPTATNMQIAYGSNAINWKTATQIIHGCSVNDVQNIEVKALETFTPGPGVLTGIITETVGYGNRPFGSSYDGSAFKPTIPGQPIGGIIVKGGRNPGGQMFTQTITESTGPVPAKGTYTLSGLPLGDYFILVDIPGLDTNNTYHVKITSSDTVFNNLDFTVDSIQINPVFDPNVSVREIETQDHKISVFPNPATNFVTIKYSLQSNSSVKIEVFDIFGKLVKTLLPLTQQNTNNYKTTWNLDELTSGLYFIKTTINGSENVIKLSITN
ncbi:MAG: GEVED domain-containing protein [Bacteroidia bacterium]